MNQAISITDRRDGFYVGFCAGYNGQAFKVVCDSHVYASAYLNGFNQGTAYRKLDDREQEKVFRLIVTIAAVSIASGAEEEATIEAALLVSRAELAQLREVEAFNNRLAPISSEGVLLQ